MGGTIMKHIARKVHERNYNTAKEWLDNFYQKGNQGKEITDAEREQALKHIKNKTSVDEKLLKYIIDFFDEIKMEYFSAPYEADGQLIKLEKDGIIDGIITMDGDVIHLRAKKVFFDVDYNKKEWKVY
jgi:5'-3' exonuclease